MYWFVFIALIPGYELSKHAMELFCFPYVLGGQGVQVVFLWGFLSTGAGQTVCAPFQSADLIAVLQAICVEIISDYPPTLILYIFKMDFPRQMQPRPQIAMTRSAFCVTSI